MIIVEEYIKENKGFKHTNTFYVETMEEAENIASNCDYYVIWNNMDEIVYFNDNSY